MFLARFLQRHLSLMLAVRYLNPLRTHFSIITLICLLGVSLGVMVLIVVLSVMGGLQKEIRDRILAQTPHVLINYAPEKDKLSLIEDWQPLVTELEKLPGVQTAYAQIEDYALIDFYGSQRPGLFRAIDTENKRQMEELSKQPVVGSFQLGFEDEAVVSSKFARDMMITPGDVLRIYSTRNFDPLFKIYRQSENPPLKTREEFLIFHDLVKNNPTQISLTSENQKSLHEALVKLTNYPHRDIETQYLNSISQILLNFNGKTLPKEVSADLSNAILALENLEADKSDLDAFRDVKSLVLPKEMKVIGIYQASNHIATPDLFMPLNSAQEILETGGGVHGIALRLEQPYTAAEQVASIQEKLPEGYIAQPWTQRFEQWFRLINQERMMMTFVLSFIVLIAGFCIMAVMFTVTVQRKKEIAVMMALGATPAKVVKIFLWQGIIIGILGSTLGVIFGLLVIHYRMEIQHFLKMLNFDPFPMAFHGVELPAIINPSEIIWISTGAFLMVTLVAIIPSLFAAFQDPAKSLRSL